MNVLSLCDGMSCGQIALRELNIPVEEYYASEIDKFAIAQTQLNFPNTIQLGDLRNWKNWDIDWGSIDLILAGTPCTGFSFAGKQLAFDDPQSKLFFDFADILNHVRKLNSDVKFLLENVKMKKDYLRVISESVGVRPVLINSALVSAQNRERYYWTDIRIKRIGLFGELCSDIPQPEDRGILLRDILEDEVDEKYYCNDKRIAYLTKEFRLKKKFTQINGDKALTLCMRSTKNWNGDYIRTNRGIRYLTPKEHALLQTIPEWYRWECSDTQIYGMCGNGWWEEFEREFALVGNMHDNPELLKPQQSHEIE